MSHQRLLSNPYTNRSAIRSADDFFGRTKEMTDTYKRLLGAQCVSLIGERRTGKSSILNALEFERDEFEIPSEYRFTLVDLQYISGCSEEDFLNYLLKRLSKSTGIRVEGGQPPRISLERLVKTAQRAGQRLVIALDEFEYLVDNKSIKPEFFGFLRSWITQFRVPFVIASREGTVDRMTEADSTGSAFLNIFTPIYIGPLRADEAGELILTPAERGEVEFDEDEVSLILDLAGFFPFFIQIACYHMFELKQCGTPMPETKESLVRAFSLETASHFKYLLQRLSPPELSALRNYVSGKKEDTDDSAREQLMRKGILIRRGQELRVFSTVFADLIRAEYADYKAAPQPSDGMGIIGMMHAVKARLLE